MCFALCALRFFAIRREGAMAVTTVTIREATEATDTDAVQRWADREFDKVSAQPWYTAKVVLAAERDDVLIGAAIGKCAAGVAHLGELIVAERERNSGVGAQLLAAFETWAQAQGAHKCTLNTDRDRPAVRFYERHGWHTLCVLDDHYEHRTSLLMGKAMPPRP